MGLGHEHQNPFGGIKWNETALYEEYAGHPNYWTPEKTRFNVIRKYEKNQTNGVYDPDSIMHYTFKPGLTINKCCDKINDDLSIGDKQIIQKLYKKFKPSRGK